MAISRAADIYIGYEQEPEREDILENLGDPDWAGYYDLPFVYDDTGNYLCIPLPLVSRHFRNHIIWSCSKWQDREAEGHDRNHWRLSHSDERQQVAQRELRRRFEYLVDESYRNMAIGTILREVEPAEEQRPVEVLEPQWLGPQTLAKLNDPKYAVEDFAL